MLLLLVLLKPLLLLLCLRAEMSWFCWVPSWLAELSHCCLYQLLLQHLLLQPTVPAPGASHDWDARDAASLWARQSPYEQMGWQKLRRRLQPVQPQQQQQQLLAERVLAARYC